MRSKKELSYIQAFLKQRPFFFSLIRPTEAKLFYSHRKLIRKRTLDFGCGDGFFLQSVFQDWKHKVVGVDVPESNIHEASSVDIYSDLVTYDGGGLPFEDSSFDTCIANSVLEHVPDVERSVSEIARVIHSKGYFITSVMTSKWEKSLLGSWLFGSTYTKWLRTKQVHVSLYSFEEWQAVFEAAGFDIIKSVGYLSPKVIRLLELSHYLSIPSLVSRNLFGVWVIWQQWYCVLRLDRLVQWLLQDTRVSPDHAGSVFFVLKKRVSQK